MTLPPRKPTRKLTPRKALARLKGAFRSELGIGVKTADDLLAGARLYDKAYELFCLIETMRQLKSAVSSASFHLVGGAKPKFRGKGGQIQRHTWPYIEMRDGSGSIAEIWVDIECWALSAWCQGHAPGNPPYSRAHELDIVLVRPSTTGRPEPHELFLGIEAKHRPFNKALLKELMGVRRETAFKAIPQDNPFAWWRSDRRIPADPASGIVLFCSHASVHNYTGQAGFWGIEMIHHPC